MNSDSDKKNENDKKQNHQIKKILSLLNKYEETSQTKFENCDFNKLKNLYKIVNSLVMSMNSNNVNVSEKVSNSINDKNVNFNKNFKDSDLNI